MPIRFWIIPALGLLVAGAAARIAHSAPPAGDLAPRDLTPVTWLEPPAHPPIEIVRDGRPRAVVHVADPTGREPFVRDLIDGRGLNKNPFGQSLTRMRHELIEAIRLRTGATLEQVDEFPAVDQPAIVIGACEETRRAGIDTSRLPPEGFVVVTAPNRVYLVGSTQQLAPRANGALPRSDGTAWAVADFLERFAGVRWYWPAEFGGRSIPRDRSLVVPPVHYRDQPVFRQREDQRDTMVGPQNPLTISYHLIRGVPKMPHPFAPGVIPFHAGVNPGGDTPAKYYSRLNMGTQQMTLWRLGSSLDYEQGITQGSWGGAVCRDPGDPLRSEAVFALRDDGTRDTQWNCFSAPQTLDAYLDRLERNWDTRTRNDSVHCIIVRNSVTVYFPRFECRCPSCRQTMAQGGAERVMGLFLQRLCAAVQQRWPGKKVVLYAGDRKAPPQLKFPDNLVVAMDLRCDLGLMGQPEVRREWDDTIQGWGARLLLEGGSYQPSNWTYAPVQYPHVVQDFYRRHRDAIEGSFFHSYGENIRVTGAPTWYVWKRVLWNPELDVDATLDEMCRRLFGPGAEPARELLRLQCDCWERARLSRPLRDGDLNPPDQAHRLPDRVFREIWPADVVARMKSLRDRALLDIAAAGDTAARQAFLYWTWTFDAFLLDAQRIHLEAEPLPTVALDLGGGLEMKLVRIPAGEFLMGSPADEPWRRDHEGPQHLVRITKPFLMATHEVTREQWEAVMGEQAAVENFPGATPLPADFLGGRRPVGVSWRGADDFCRMLSRKTGKTVRLPTEAEWEYACRAGGSTTWCFGDYVGALGRYATYDTVGYGPFEEDCGPQDVGRRRPNAWGLHDMHGNASELVQDWYSPTAYQESATDDPTGPASGTQRVRRGGAWCHHLGLTRSASRQVSPDPGLTGGGHAWGGVEEGFRVVVEEARERP